MNLTWYKNGCGGEVDPLVSEACPSATQVSEKIGHVLEGAHFLRLWGRGWSKKGVCKSEALSLVLPSSRQQLLPPLPEDCSAEARHFTGSAKIAG